MDCSIVKGCMDNITNMKLFYTLLQYVGWSQYKGYATVSKWVTVLLLLFV